MDKNGSEKLKAHFPPLTSSSKPVYIAIYVPNTIGSKIMNDEYHAKRAYGVATFLSNRFKGTTSIQGRGTWLPETGPLTKDKVFIVTSFCSRTRWERHKNELIDYLTKKKRDWKQKSIAFVYDDKTKYYPYAGMHFI